MSSLGSSDDSQSALYCYGNYTNRIQVAIATSNSKPNLERILFPGDKFLFEASDRANLELYVEIAGNTILLDRISGSDLQVRDVSTEVI